MVDAHILKPNWTLCHAPGSWNEQNEQKWTKISKSPKRPKMTRNRFVSLLEVSLQSLGPLQCPEGVLGGGYTCPKYVPGVSEILYPLWGQ